MVRILSTRSLVVLDIIHASTQTLQMLSALEMCHSTGIAHRDIKPENILLDDNFQLRMADFGLSSIMEVSEAK